MEERFYLIKLLINDKGQGAPTITEYNNKTDAIVAYHQTCAMYHNAQDVMWAYVYVQSTDGNLVKAPEIINHIPKVEPEQPEEVTEP